jgi:hypothetical protein
MAEEITLKVNVETGKAVTNLGNLEKATKGVTKATKQADQGAATLEQQFDTLNKEIKEGPVNIRRMNKQIQEYQAIALEAGRTSPLGKKAIQEAAQLKDRYNDITAEVNRLANDGVKMQAALDIGTTVIAGYAAFQGALAIAGVDSEKYRETLMKLQGAQSLLMGIETLRKNLEKESTVVLVAKTTAEKIATIATKAYTFVTGGATAITKLLRLALLSLPFVAIGAAIIALVSYWDEFTGAIKSALNWLGLYDDSAEKAQARTKARLKKEKTQRENRLKQIENSAKREQALHDQRITGLDNEIKIAKSLGKNTVELERTKLKAVIEFHKGQKPLIEESIRLKKKEIELKIADLELTANYSKAVSKLLNLEGKIAEQKQLLLDLDDEKIQATQAIENAEVGLLVFENEIQLEKRKVYKKTAEENKKVSDKEIEDAQKAADDKLKIEKDLSAKLLEDEIKLEDQQWQLLQEITNTEQEFELLKLAQQYDKKNALAVGNAELINLLKEQEEKDAAAIDKKYRDKDIERAQAVKDAKTQMALDGLNAIMSLTDAFTKDNEKSQKRAFEINKKLQIAMALIQTYQGVQAIFAAKAASPETILFPAAPFIAAGIALATGLANVQNIRKQQFSGGASGGSFGGGGGVPGGGGAAPQIEPVTNTSTLVPQGPQQVYVTETDISETQNKVNVIEAQSTF